MSIASGNVTSSFSHANNRIWRKKQIFVSVQNPLICNGYLEEILDGAAAGFRRVCNRKIAKLIFSAKPKFNDWVIGINVHLTDTVGASLENNLSKSPADQQRAAIKLV